MKYKDKLIRLIARLDVKGENLIKGVHMEGLRVIGDPQDYARFYYESGADEIIYMDIVASLYGRSNLLEIVKKTASDVFIPLTVGGGVRSIDDVTGLLRAGADKVAINTAAVKNPYLIRDISRRFGSQCMVLSIDAKKDMQTGGWKVYMDGGREPADLDVVEWAKKAEELGAGEILLTSVDMEGTRKGFDIKLIKAVTDAVSVPVIASGGYGASSHLNDAVKIAGADAIAFADALHFKRTSFDEIRRNAKRDDISVREMHE